MTKEIREISPVDQAKNTIIKSQKAFEAVLPKNFDVQKFIATFCLEIQKTPKLAQCSNLIEVGRDVANFGLVIGGLANQAYLIPFWNSKKNCYIAQLIIGYRGYITKLEEAGYTVEAEIVTNQEVDNGFFGELRGSKTEIVHRPIRKGIRDRENIALAYCIIKGNNTPPVISVLSREEIEEIAKTDNWVDGNKIKSLSNVWLNEDRKTDFGQQCIKTVIRNAVKKVNLRIANEMSAYEGQVEDENLKDVSPVSKTATAHQVPPSLLIQEPQQPRMFEDPKEPENQIEMFEEQPAQDEEEFEVPFQQKDAKAEEIFKRVSNQLKVLTTTRAVNVYLAGEKGDVDYLGANKPQYFAEIQEIKNKQLKKLAEDQF